ncbi:Putative universal stress protein [Aquicella siphonis]|uniref:Universal stress protein n=1 Tax=Aquicella siphonis TaxID=254247 RepID=A0A5E4PKU0_9COXI|nr:universal stress protein [Aquicella siphonis]VVC77027.1 Putative universal stress protein [Aquicella siphonis]
MPYQRILVAVDGSATSQTALKNAVVLANALKAKLRVIHVVDEYLGYIDGLSFDLDQYIQSIRRHGELVLAKMREITNKAGVEAEFDMHEISEAPARIPERIVEDANQWKADLLVIGTHGRSGLGRLILGSVADAVIRLAHIPVLLTRGDENE